MGTPTGTDWDWRQDYENGRQEADLLNRHGTKY